MASTTKARVTLGKRPDTIHRTVSAQLPEGGEVMLGIDYKNRTRTQYGELLDSRMKEAQQADEAKRAEAEAYEVRRRAQRMEDEPLPPLPGPSSAETQRITRDATARHILDIATGWDLPEPFDLDNVTQLCDELPGLASAIVDDYRVAIIEGRRGNF